MKKIEIKGKQLTTKNVTPTKGKILIAIKSWPSQSKEGIIINAETHTVIRGELYVSEVIKSSIENSKYKKGDIIIVSMYSGNHINTSDAKTKIISEGDILMYKTKEEMNKTKSFAPDSFTPGINYILVKEKTIKEVTTTGGIIISKKIQEDTDKTDYATKVTTVVKIGDIKKIEGMNIEEYPKMIKIGTEIITDTFVGLPMNQQNTSPEYIYNIMYIFDAIGIIE